jgi:hypothetical protein
MRMSQVLTTVQDVYARAKRGPVILVSSEARFRTMLAGLRPGLARKPARSISNHMSPAAENLPARFPTT